MVFTKDIVKMYMDAWNEQDEAKRRKLLDAAWADDATYTDPMSHAADRDALIDLIAGFHKQMPGASISQVSGIDEHHGRLRFAWKMQQKDGSTGMEGIDIGQLAEDGRLQSIVGFFGPPPARVLMSECLLCRIAVGDVETRQLYSDDLVVAFDIPREYPWRQAPVHFLTISREHIPSAGHIRDEHGPIIARMFAAIAKVAADLGVAETGYRIATNVGEDAGQTEFHLHLHCLGGRKLGAKG